MKSFLLLAGLAASALIDATAVRAREYVVDGRNSQSSDAGPGTAERPLKTLAKAADLARAGDTVVVKPSVYRERVRLAHSGTPSAPIAFRADPPGSVVVTGADIVKGWQRVAGEAPIFRVPWPHRFVMWKSQGREFEHYPHALPEFPDCPDEPRWGRAEQVIVDGRQLIPFRSLADLS